MNQVDKSVIKTGTVFPEYPKAQGALPPHVINVKQDKLYALELEDETATETRAKEYRISMNPFGQRTLVKQEFLYNTKTKEAVGEKYRFVPTKSVREIDVKTLDSIRWEHVSKGNYGAGQLLRFSLRIAIVVGFLWLCLVGFNWFIQGERGAKFLYNQMMDRYLSMEYEETTVSNELATQMMDMEYFIIYDYVNDVVVQKYGEVMLFDMGEQGRYTYYLFQNEELPENFKKYMPDMYFNQGTFDKQRVIQLDQGNAYVLEGDISILYYPEGAFVSSDEGLVKILFKQMDPIFVYGK